jgi:hypothetical protein
MKNWPPSIAWPAPYVAGAVRGRHGNVEQFRDRQRVDGEVMQQLVSDRDDHLGGEAPALEDVGAGLVVGHAEQPALPLHQAIWPQRRHLDFPRVLLAG